MSFISSVFSNLKVDLTMQLFRYEISLTSLILSLVLGTEKILETMSKLEGHRILITQSFKNLSISYKIGLILHFEGLNIILIKYNCERG